MRLKEYVEVLSELVARDVDIQGKLNGEMIRRINALERAVKALAEEVKKCTP
jgi:hypothetical protein